MDSLASCYLCGTLVVLKGGDKGDFAEHMSDVHGVTSNTSFLAAWNFLDPNVRSNIESLVMSITVQSEQYGDNTIKDSLENNLEDQKLIIDEHAHDDPLDDLYEMDVQNYESQQNEISKRKRETNIKQSRINSNKRIKKDNAIIKNEPEEHEENAFIKNGEFCEVQVKEEYEESPIRNKSKTPTKFENNIDTDASEPVSPDKCLPAGWKAKIKTIRKRANRNSISQTHVNQFISPEGTIFTNCKDVEKNMKEMGIYSEEDIVKARQYMIYLSLK